MLSFCLQTSRHRTSEEHPPTPAKGGPPALCSPTQGPPVLSAWASPAQSKASSSTSDCVVTTFPYLFPTTLH